MMLKFYLWVMGWSGKINTWAWHKQATIIKEEQKKTTRDVDKKRGEL